MGQGDSARDFVSSESMKNAEILCVFPIFHTARLGQKIRRSPQLPLCGVALIPFGGYETIFFCDGVKDGKGKDLATNFHIDQIGSVPQILIVFRKHPVFFQQFVCEIFLPRRLFRGYGGMGLLRLCRSLGLCAGEELTVAAEGADEQTAVDNIEKFLSGQVA